jgi:hypothetical protein
MFEKRSVIAVTGVSFVSAPRLALQSLIKIDRGFRDCLLHSGQSHLKSAEPRLLLTAEGW